MIEKAAKKLYKQKDLSRFYPRNDVDIPLSEKPPHAPVQATPPQI